MIPVTKSFLPPISEYNRILERAWNAGWITNRGELVLELEQKLKEYLNIRYLTLTTNGTLPLQLAIRALELSGEIITTPFSYVATTSAIVWEHCTPVFVDIDPEFLTIDEKKIEAAITSGTQAILATHVFGNPCNIKAIQSVAAKHNLKVIYDAAHGFGVNYQGRSLLSYGDIVTCSFHATKIFHTGEGGAVICNDESLHHKLFYHHNFGHNGPLEFHGLGINAKMSELQAAMGLAVFPYLTKIHDERKIIVDLYTKLLNDSGVKLLTIRESTEWNYSYFPVFFSSEPALEHCVKRLSEIDVVPRRYFYPSLNTLPYIMPGSSCPNSEKISKTVLSLPLYVGLDLTMVERIAAIVIESEKTFKIS